jgi:hypothetical protein
VQCKKYQSLKYKMAMIRWENKPAIAPLRMHLQAHNIIAVQDLILEKCF